MTEGFYMRATTGISLLLVWCFSHAVSAESLRCQGDIIEVGSTKLDVFSKCGEAAFKDSYCEKTPSRIKRADGNYENLERCENVEVWSYNPGKGQFWTNLYFREGKVWEMRYGDRVK
jgi:Protein of unknown function (DUF2845)